jgi:hypothetical protein
MGQRRVFFQDRERIQAIVAPIRDLIGSVNASAFPNGSIERQSILLPPHSSAEARIR